MSTCQPSSVPHVKVNDLYSIWSLYLLFLFNLVPLFVNINQFGPIEDVTKFIFYIKVIMM